VSKRDRRDSDRRGERRDSQPEDEQQRRAGETEVQESDSLAALKAILSKVAALLKPLQLTPDESIRLVEQLYGKVLETDLELAAETDDTRKSSVLAAIQNATIRREGDKIVVDYSTEPEEAQAPGDEGTPPVGESGAAVAGDAEEVQRTNAAAEITATAASEAGHAQAEGTPRRTASRRASAARSTPAATTPAEAEPREERPDTGA